METGGADHVPDIPDKGIGRLFVVFGPVGVFCPNVSRVEGCVERRELLQVQVKDSQLIEASPKFPETWS